MEFLYLLISAVGVVVWFFFKSFLNEYKNLRKEFDDHKHDVSNDLGKLRGRVDLLEMDIKSEIKTFKQVSEMQYKQIHSDINELKQMIQNLK